MDMLTLVTELMVDDVPLAEEVRELVTRRWLAERSSSRTRLDLAS